MGIVRQDAIQACIHALVGSYKYYTSFGIMTGASGAATHTR